MIKVHILDQSETERHDLVELFEATEGGLEVSSTPTLTEAIEVLKNCPVDMIIIDGETVDGEDQRVFQEFLDLLAENKTRAVLMPELNRGFHTALQSKVSSIVMYKDILNVSQVKLMLRFFN